MHQQNLAVLLVQGILGYLVDHPGQDFQWLPLDRKDPSLLLSQAGHFDLLLLGYPRVQLDLELLKLPLLQAVHSAQAGLRSPFLL